MALGVSLRTFDDRWVVQRVDHAIRRINRYPSAGYLLAKQTMLSTSYIKHLITDLKGNSEFCFPENFKHKVVLYATFNR